MLFPGDTIRVYYHRMIGAGDTVRVNYLGSPGIMTSDTYDCEVPEDLHNFIIEEALAFYFFSQKRIQEAQAIRQGVRFDLGVTEPKK